MDQLIQSGLYTDIGSLAVIAIENLLTAEDEAAGSTGVNALAATAAKEAEEARGKRPSRNERAPSSVRHLNACFAWEGTPNAAKKMVRPFSPDRFGPDDAVPLERWVFGQQNRIVPLKVNSRLLLQMLADFDDSPLLSAVADEVSRLAAGAYEAFNRVDSRLAHKKDDLLSTAFPSPGSDKSRQRYADQFVATENMKGELSGLLVDWKLAAVERKKGKALLYPTEACVAFADLASPLLDADPIDSFKAKFSSEEIDWALGHISMHVRVEEYAYLTLLRGIIAGANDPSSLDKHLRDAGVVEDRKTSADFVATQRSGALSRMADLELVRRVRNGVRITYEVTEKAAAWTATRSN